MTQFQVRTAIASDGPEILAIYAPFITEGAVSFEMDVPTVEEMNARRRTLQARMPYLVATAGGRIAGYAYAGPHRSRAAYQWAVESSVYVSPAFHRCGVGRRLYRALFSVLEAQGFAQVFAGVTLPNGPSVGFHEAFGFQPVGVYRGVGFKAGNWVDVGWWAHPLPAAATLSPDPPRALSTAEVDALVSGERWTA